MNGISYLLDRRTLARGVAHVAVAVPVGLYVAAPYDQAWLKVVAFLIPVGAMVYSLRHTRNEELATVISLVDRRQDTQDHDVESVHGNTHDLPRLHHGVLG